jgi:uncharacterized membrane protein YgcG
MFEMLTLIIISALAYGGYFIWRKLRDEENAAIEALEKITKDAPDNSMKKVDDVYTPKPSLSFPDRPLDPWKKTPTPIPAKKAEPVKKREDDYSFTDNLTSAAIGAVVGSMLSSGSRDSGSSSSSDWGSSSSSSSSSNDSFSSGGGDSGGGGSSSDF